MRYPTTLSADDDFVIAQLSDLHLHGQIGIDSSYHKCLSMLEFAKHYKPKLLLLTGDLVNDGIREGYDWLFEQLHNTGIPFLCLAGNHDTTEEVGTHLPFHQRRFLPKALDTRLIRQHKLIINLSQGTWQILAINSAVLGQTIGQIDAPTLKFLTRELDTGLPTIIAMHHHPITVQSAWIDAYMLQNHQQFWQALAPFPNLKAVLCGHVHQAHHLPSPTGSSVYTCPATARQFLPFADTFATDDLAGGLRLIQLSNNLSLQSYIKRVHNIGL